MIRHWKLYLLLFLLGLDVGLSAQSYPLFNRFDAKAGNYTRIERKFYGTDKAYAITTDPIEHNVYTVKENGYILQLDEIYPDKKEIPQNPLANRSRTEFAYQSIDGYELIESFENNRPDAPYSRSDYEYTIKRVKDTVIIKQQRKGETKSHTMFYMNTSGKIVREVIFDYDDSPAMRHEFSFVLDKQGRPAKRTHRANGRVVSIDHYVYNAEGFLSEKRKITSPGKLEGFLYKYTYVLNAEGNWTEERCVSHVLDGKGKIIDGYSSYYLTTQNYSN